MAVLKRRCVLPLAALLVLSIDPTAAEVVDSMSDCAGFLLDETPPHVPGILEGGKILNPERYKPICQTLNNRRHFVTLYDTENKIPVFSAYKYKRGYRSKRPDEKWKIEPQLENMQDGKNMEEPEGDKTCNHQAVNGDYINTGFDRGHLFPSSYAYNEDDKKSTFTLTNIVPQERDFNQGRWNYMEQCIRCVLNQYCFTNTYMGVFLVTGAQPGNNRLKKNKINIPSMLWSAFCCYSRSEKKWLASAHWGENVPDVFAYLQTKTLAELRCKLGIKVFPGSRCPDTTTVTYLYPKVGSNCNCPPT